MKAFAFANNDVVYLWWTNSAKIPGCLGFSVRRIQNGKPDAALPAFVGFDVEDAKVAKKPTTDFWPIQSFQWKDVRAPRDVDLVYEIVAMTGEPGKKLKPVPGFSVKTNVVSAADVLPPFRVVFNRGLISTQAISRRIERTAAGKPNSGALRKHIGTPGDPIRKSLAAEVLDALPSLLERARQEGGKCFCALYELSDEGMIRAIEAASENVEVILSNTGGDDATNEASRKRLHEALGDRVHDRMLGGSGFFIGHNKFVVYVDDQGTPQTVLTGSTNWTPTGLCAQTNNVLVINSQDVAQDYLEYWQALLADDAVQAEELRDLDATRRTEHSLGDGAGSVRIWFSPNTPQKRKPAKNPPTPPDLEEVFAAISAAKNGVLFLLFNSGAPSIVSHLKTVEAERKEAGEPLYIRGAISDDTQAGQFKTRVYNDSVLKGPNTLITGIGGVRDDFAFWEAEIAKLGHAVIHDKVVVIDPFSDDSVVITGSHNLGFKASYSNDENMCIIRGNRRVAEAYAAHVLDVVNHFNFRTKLQELSQEGKLDQAFSDLKEDDKWQDKYFRNNFLASRDLFFFPDSAADAAGG